MLGAVWSIQWNNPYTQPPEGMPRVLAEFFYFNDDPRARLLPDDVSEYFDKHCVLGGGYSIYWQPVYLPREASDPEKLVKIRKERLKKRITKKYPLFAEQFIEEELKKKKNYYEGSLDTKEEQEKASITEKEEIRVRELLEKRVIIYWEGGNDV